MTRMTDAGRKKYLCWVFIAFLIGCLGTAPEGFASEETGVKVLTLDEALRITLEKNKDIQKAREYRNMVEGRYIEERAAVLPQLQVTALVSRDRDESLATFFRGLIPVEKETRSGEISLTQALYTFGRIGAAIRAAKIGLATAEDQACASSVRLRSVMSPPHSTTFSWPKSFTRWPPRSWTRGCATWMKPARSLWPAWPRSTMSWQRR